MATMIKTVGPALERADGNHEHAPERPIGLPGATLHLVQRLWRMARLRRERRRAELQLKSLSDGQLKDLGFHRSEISSVLYGAGYDTTRRLYGADAAGWPTGSKSG
ncbi:MAG: DUF1127 domain-containing protein [Pseudomonadota bacterium]